MSSCVFRCSRTPARCGGVGASPASSSRHQKELKRLVARGKSTVRVPAAAGHMCPDVTDAFVDVHNMCTHRYVEKPALI